MVDEATDDEREGWALRHPLLAVVAVAGAAVVMMALWGRAGPHGPRPQPCPTAVRSATLSRRWLA